VHWVGGRLLLDHMLGRLVDEKVDVISGDPTVGPSALNLVDIDTFALCVVPHSRGGKRFPTNSNFLLSFRSLSVRGHRLCGLSRWCLGSVDFNSGSFCIRFNRHDGVADSADRIVSEVDVLNDAARSGGDLRNKLVGEHFTKIFVL
jgi:hypothetical protein